MAGARAHAARTVRGGMEGASNRMPWNVRHCSVLALSCLVILSGSPAAAQDRFSIRALRDALSTGSLVAQAQTGGTQAAPSAAQTAEPVRRLTMEEAVRLALENNLGVRLARFAPQMEDL